MKIKYIYYTIIVISILILIYFIADYLISNNEYGFNLQYNIKLFYNQIKIYLNSLLNIQDKSIPIISDYSRIYEQLNLPQNQRDTYSFVGSAVIDINNDGKELLFVGGTAKQQDALLKYSESDNKFINIISGTGIIKNINDPTYSAVSFDINNNGFCDLIVARQSGVYVYMNDGNSKFVEKKIYNQFEDSVPTALSIGDYDKDGLADIYISRFPPANKLLAFQFNNPAHYRKNILLRNMGNLNFQDVTEETNTGGNQNTFTSIFVDLGSKKPDLVIAHDTGKIEILKNNNSNYEQIQLSDEITPYGFWMGIGAGDFNNDGNIDFFFTNVGNTLPMSETRGIKGDPNKGGIKENQKLTNKHLLLKNNSNYNFSNVSDETNVADYGFGWGSIFEDINLDGYLDLIFAQNYIDFPHPTLLQGAVFYGNGNKFIKQPIFKNQYYGHTPVSIDFNGDGIKDLIWVNMIGPVVGYIIQNKNNNNYINIRLPDNVDFLNATVTIKYNNTKQVRQNIIGGIGFGGDQSHIMAFGLGKINKIDIIIVETLYNIKYEIKNPIINKTIVINKMGKFMYR